MRGKSVGRGGRVGEGGGRVKLHRLIARSNGALETT